VEADEEVTEPGTRRARAGAAKLTERDKDMLGLLGVARYMTAPQVHRLCFEGRHQSLAYRRLLRLSRSEDGPAFVQQRFFRKYDGSRVAVWAPTPHGLAAASVRNGGLPELPRHDVGAQFLEHLVQLNELFVALWRTGDARCARVAHQSFCWVPSDCVRLTFDEYQIRGQHLAARGRHQLRVIQPDAVLEVPIQRRRYFLECEMGGHTISPGPSKPGATLSKTERYNEYLSGLADSNKGQTYYAAQYPDAFAAEVLFLVRSPGRASTINAALAHWRDDCRGLAMRFAVIRALTFDEAAFELRLLVGLPGRAGPSPTGKPPPPLPTGYTLTREEFLLVARYFKDAAASIHRARDAFRALKRADLPEYPASLMAAGTLMERLMPGSTR